LSARQSNARRFTTDAGLQRCAKAYWQGHQGELNVTLDGTALNPPGYVGATGAFAFTMPAHNNYLHLPGRTKGRAAIYGSATILRPFSPGTHTLVAVDAFAHTSYGVQVTYHLTVG
jgi:hypothetical protein